MSYEDVRRNVLSRARETCPMCDAAEEEYRHRTTVNNAARVMHNFEQGSSTWESNPKYKEPYLAAAEALWAAGMLR